MRLIDADELKALRGVAIYATDEKTDTQIITASVYRREEIDKAPTVEAIPIEWIEGRIKDIMQTPDLTDEPWFPITHAEVVILEDLIEDWEKEQCAKQQNTTSE